MKWIGQHIWDFISRFRSDVYLEATESGTIASGGNLGLDSNNKIVKSASPSGTIDLTSEVTGTLPVSSGGTGATTLVDNAILTGTGTSAITAESTLAYIDGVLVVSSGDSGEPGIYISNTNEDAVSSLMRFSKSATGVDGDDIGRVEFYASNDGDELTSFAQILGEIGTAADTDEAGKLSLLVATSNGSTSALQQALTATGHGTANKVDIGLGYGASSLTTVAGDLDIDGDTITAPGILNINPSGSVLQVDAALIQQTNSTAAVFNISNTGDNDTGGSLVLNNTGGGVDMSNDDSLGMITFSGMDDGTPSAQTYGIIETTIANVVDSDEAGKMELTVATEGTQRQGLTATGDGASSKVDIGLGYGAASTTTIAGTLTMGSTAAMTNAGLLSVANQSNITGLGTISSGAWQGTAIADAYVANNLTISGGTVNNSVIGGTTPAAITGTTVDATTDFTVGTTVITDDQIQFTPSTDDTVTIAAGSSGTLNITTVDAAGMNAEINITADGIISTTSSTNQINTTYDFHATTFENLITAGKPSGKILKYMPAGDSTLTAGQVYYLRTNGAWLQADADSASTSSVLLGLGMGGSSQTVGVMIEGFMRIPAAEILNVPTDVDGLPVYLGTEAGHFDFTAPSASGDIVRVLGYAIDDDSGDVLIYFNPDRTWIEIA